MDYLTIKAASVATERGDFTAYAATWSIDRAQEQIVRGAFAETISRWQESGKRVPVHWDHSGEASDVIGSIDPASMVERDEGPRVSGRLHLEESETAREAWRLMKDNAVSLSFGYLTTKSRDREDGIKELQAIDLFEVSIVPHPANPDTRFVELKSANAESASTALSDEELWLPRSGAQQKSAAPPSIETIEQDIERIAKASRPVRFESFEG
jgi:uncharacterized protein